jgi:hypothetical protein
MSKTKEPKLMALIPPASKREQQMNEYRTRLATDAWHLVRKFVEQGMPARKRGSVTERYNVLKHRIELLNKAIEAERMARGLFQDQVGGPWFSFGVFTKSMAACLPRK